MASTKLHTFVECDETWIRSGRKFNRGRMVQRKNTMVYNDTFQNHFDTFFRFSEYGRGLKNYYICGGFLTDHQQH